jgi:hypothetical protein
MQGVKGLIILSVVAAAIAVSACRREAEYRPLKLGGPAAASTQLAR